MRTDAEDELRSAVAELRRAIATLRAACRDVPAYLYDRGHDGTEKECDGCDMRKRIRTALAATAKYEEPTR